MLVLLVTGFCLIVIAEQLTDYWTKTSKDYVEYPVQEAFSFRIVIIISAVQIVNSWIINILPRHDVNFWFDWIATTLFYLAIIVIAKYRIKWLYILLFFYSTIINYHCSS